MAIVGNFHRGKSTLVNALLGKNVAGKGQGLATTHANLTFALSPQIKILDTPGFDANQRDTQKALCALEKADIFIYVHENTALGTACEEPIFKIARDSGKSVLFLLNCLRHEKWEPERNSDIVDYVESELTNLGLLRNIIALGTHHVIPINALWASFGEGLLDTGLEKDRDDVESIRHYALKNLKIPVAAYQNDDMFRAEMLRRSGVSAVQDWLLSLPMQRLSDILNNPRRTLDRILDQFVSELGKRWRNA